MANRSAVWAAMYGEDQDIGEQIRQKTLQPRQTATNNRRFLSAQSPFATDDESSTHPPPASYTQTSNSNSLALETSDRPKSGQNTRPPSGTGTQRSREMFGAGFGGGDVESPAEKPKTGGDSHVAAGHFTSAAREWEHNQAAKRSELLGSVDNIVDHSGTPTAPPRRIDERVYGVDIESEMAEAAEAAFYNDVMCCESFLNGLQASLEACKKKGDADAIARMAGKLEQVVGALNIV